MGYIYRKKMNKKNKKVIVYCLTVQENVYPNILNIPYALIGVKISESSLPVNFVRKKMEQ